MDKTYNCFTADNDIFKVPWNVWRSTLSSGFGTVMARGADDDDNYDDNLVYDGDNGDGHDHVHCHGDRDHMIVVKVKMLVTTNLTLWYMI